MKNTILVLILITLSLSINAQNNDQKENSILTALVNRNWVGIGELMGKEATFSMGWEKVLDNKFIKLEFQSKRKSSKNEDIVFSATGFYRIVNDTTVIGNWFDNRGITFPLKGSVTENEMIIHWENDETEIGKTIYYYNSKCNKIIVEDFVMRNGLYAKFGNANYTTAVSYKPKVRE